MKNVLMKTFLTFFILYLCTTTYAQNSPIAQVSKIWDKGEHNAFTDLIWYKNKFYCTFREGSDHIPGTDGIVRIIKSKDGKTWEDAGSLQEDGIDLRDPKLSITADGRLMIIIGGSHYKDRKLLGRTPFVSFSDGETFSAPKKVNINPEIVSWGDWIWRVTWHNGVGYAVDYQVGPEERKGPTDIYIVKTTDGINFSKVAKLDIDGFPNEATIRFDEHNKMVVMVRRELADQMGVMATAKAPYTDWSYQKMNYRLGGPNFIFYKNNILATSRVHSSAVYTGLLASTKSNPATFKEILSFPSAGDNSYAGMVIHKNKLWISYYSSHEGKTNIYLTTIPLKKLDSMLK